VAGRLVDLKDGSRRGGIDPNLRQAILDTERVLIHERKQAAHLDLCDDLWF
jgi:hypothetical protein